MRMTMLTTVHDPGAAELLAEGLRELGVPVELHRVCNYLNLGALIAERYEVYVPEAQLDEAQSALRWMERNAELALKDQAGGEVDPRPQPGHQTWEAPPARQAFRRTALAMLLLLAVMVLGAVHRHCSARGFGPASRPTRQALRHDPFQPDDPPRLMEDRRAEIIWGAACAPQFFCLPSRW